MTYPGIAATGMTSESKFLPSTVSGKTKMDFYWYTSLGMIQLQNQRANSILDSRQTGTTVGEIKAGLEGGVNGRYGQGVG